MIPLVQRPRARTITLAFIVLAAFTLAPLALASDVVSACSDHRLVATPAHPVGCEGLAPCPGGGCAFTLTITITTAGAGLAYCTTTFDPLGTPGDVGVGSCTRSHAFNVTASGAWGYWCHGGPTTGLDVHLDCRVT